MSENIFSSFDISSKGMSLQRARLSAVANNIANVNTTKGADGKPYKREVVVVSEVAVSSFGNQLKDQMSLIENQGDYGSKNSDGTFMETTLHFKTEKDKTPPRLVYDPYHPDANKDGYIEMPNINIVTEMVEMLSAQRAFEANEQVTESAKNIAKYSLEI